jgi:hypothetical protein
MATPIPFHKVLVTFKASSYQEFDANYQQFCKLAGGGIQNFYSKVDKHTYDLTFFYSTSKAANSGYMRLSTLLNLMPELTVKLDESK